MLTATLSGIFYIAYVDNDYPDYILHEFFDTITKEMLQHQVDDKGELHKGGRDKLKALIDKYKFSKKTGAIGAAQSEIDQIKLEMKSNINNMVANMEDISVNTV